MKISALKYLDRSVGSWLARIMPSSMGEAQGEDLSRVLVIRPGGIGDAVHLTPSLLAIKKIRPDIRLEILAEKRNAGTFELCSAVEDVFCYDIPGDLWHVLLREYDLVIDTEQWHRLSAVIARMVRAKTRAGFSTNERVRLFDKKAVYFHDEYEAEGFLRLVQAALALPLQGAITYPFLLSPSSAINNARAKLGSFDGEDFVTFFPGASIPERRWGQANFHQLAGALNRAGYPVVVVGGSGDRAEGNEIMFNHVGVNLAGQTSLAETAALLKQSSLLVSGDSGVLHIAVGLGIPTVSLFGPGIAKKWAPRGSNHIVINKNLPCSPCTKFGYTPKCPIDARCMKDITVEEVFEAVQKLLPLQQKVI